MAVSEWTAKAILSRVLDGTGKLLASVFPDTVEAAVILHGDTEANNAATTGPARKLIVNTDTGELRLLDGSTPGGLTIGAPGIVNPLVGGTRRVYTYAAAPFDTEVFTLFNLDGVVVHTFFGLRICVFLSSAAMEGVAIAELQAAVLATTPSTVILGASTPAKAGPNAANLTAVTLSAAASGSGYHNVNLTVTHNFGFPSKVVVIAEVFRMDA